MLRWVWLFTLQAAAVGVFFLFDAVPFQDLPAHAGLVALRERVAAGGPDGQYFVVAPHLGGYSLFRAMAHALSPVLGAFGAVRAIAALPAVLMPAALLFARHRLYGERSASVGFAGLALAFGLMTAFGFASYMAALPVVLVALTLWIEVMDAADRGRPTWTREIPVGALACGIVVAHGFAYVLFMTLAGVAAVALGFRRQRIVRLRCLLASLALAGWCAYVEARSPVPAGSAAWTNREPPAHFQGLLDKASLLFTPTLMTRSGIDALVAIVFWIWAVWAMLDVRKREPLGGPTHAKTLRRCAVALFVAFWALPHSVGWFGFVDGRLLPLVLLLALAAAPEARLSSRVARAFDRGAPVAASAMVALVLLASCAFQREARGYREVLAAIPTGARVLNFPLQPESRFFTAHPFVHYDKLAMIERPVLVSDLWFHQGSAVYPTTKNPALALPSSYSESHLLEIDWPRYDLGEWDYVIVRTMPDAAEPPVPAALEQVRHENGWWLYHVAIRG